MLRRKNYAWTPEDEAALKELSEKGLHLRAIALRLKRSESSVKKRAHALGVQMKKNPRYRASDLRRETSKNRINPGIS
jgi:DNA-binding NarL/FixJ family response regulator